MTSRLDRRTFLLGALFARRDQAPLLQLLPGPRLLSAGLIARNGAGRVAMRAVDGSVLRGDGPPRSAFGYNNPFRVASVSKMVTASAFMTLAAARAVDLDADISHYLGASLRHPAFPNIAITSRMLLSHCSGLRNAADFPVPFGQSLLDRLNAAAREENYGGWFAPAAEPPGVWFAYSDVNFGIVAQIVERVTGQRFDRFMHDTLFAPMRLDIGYNWSGVSQAKRTRAAAAARWLDGRWTAEVDANPPQAPAIAFYRAPEGSTDADYRLGENGLAFAPHGGLRLSLSDMDRLARLYADDGVHAGRRVLPASGLSMMAAPTWIFAPDAPNGATENGLYQRFGLGVQLPLGRTGDAFFGAESSDWRGHFGDAYGWMTGLFWNARDRSSIVYAINGMSETERPPGTRSALTAPEEVLIDIALAALRAR